MATGKVSRFAVIVMADPNPAFEAAVIGKVPCISMPPDAGIAISIAMSNIGGSG